VQQQEHEEEREAVNARIGKVGKDYKVIVK